MSAFLVLGTTIAATLVSGGSAQALGVEKVCYKAHIANYGWQDWKCQGGQAGFTGRNQPIEAMEITISGFGDFCAKSHRRDLGWEGLECVSSGEVIQVGEPGRSMRLEAVEIHTASPGVHGRAHVQNKGWLNPVAGHVFTLGTTGEARNLEAVEIWKE
ncbi:hypothetical protein [Streptomyces phaeofaciens]|uniref:hypothetical protein n=1 Tax=Streptomyces phaeofaciens TaxID=68254 RepID=UPI0036BDCD57